VRRLVAEMSIGSSEYLRAVDGGLAQEDPAVPALAREDSLTAALELGWRIAELYAHVDDTGEPSADTLLPAHQSLEPADQLELQLRAAAGNARRAGLVERGAALEELRQSARRAPRSLVAAEAFRAEVRRCHIDLDKDLWARDESAGKAYELGNGMSDTYSRIRRAYGGSTEDPKTAWDKTFHSDRIERLKKLLDDLQSRLNPAGVAVLRRHLDQWHKRVEDELKSGKLPELEEVRDGLRRQTVIWRQLIAGDKEPEAWLDSHECAEVRTQLRELAWKRYVRWLPLIAGTLFALIFFLPQILSWYNESFVGTGIASAVVAVTGALGITNASVLLTVRTRLHQWSEQRSELLWNRAVVNRVSAETLLIDSVFSAPPPKPRSVGGAAVGIGRKTKQALGERLGPAPARAAQTTL
jgi:hypothetical protein